MPNTHWSTGLPIAITVCDREGIILEMNEHSREAFAADGGAKLIGTNVLDCHPEPSKSQLADMLRNETRNTYTIEKNGVRKLICQTPWYKAGKYMGFVELAIDIPPTMPHKVREG